MYLLHSYIIKVHFQEIYRTSPPPNFPKQTKPHRSPATTSKIPPHYTLSTPPYHPASPSTYTTHTHTQTHIYTHDHRRHGTRPSKASPVLERKTSAHCRTRAATPQMPQPLHVSRACMYAICIYIYAYRYTYTLEDAFVRRYYYCCCCICSESAAFDAPPTSHGMSAAMYVCTLCTT